MNKVRSYLLDELGDPDAPIGSPLWSLWLANEIRKTLYDNQQTGTRLCYLVDAFKKHAAWQELGFRTWEEFCAQKLQTDSKQVESQRTLPLFEQSTPTVAGCKLGRELGNCPLKDHCGSLYDVMRYLIPEWSIREYIKATMGHDPTVRAYLARLDAAVPGKQPLSATRG
jgi:hypothetical protein